MLGSFKVRFLIVIIIVTAVGFLWQSSDNTRRLVEPTVRYVMGTDYNIKEIASQWISNMKSSRSRTIPAAATDTIQVPCKFSSIKRNYGWYYDEDLQKQEFYPGICLNVDNNTLVKPVLAGKVAKISGNTGNRTVLIEHNDKLFSSYEGLKEVLVDNNEIINKNAAIGKTGSTLYFEIRNQDGPIDPQSIFAQ